MSNTDGYAGEMKDKTATCILYNSLANTWTPFTSLPVVIAYPIMLTLAGRPFVFGGFNEDNGTLDTVYSYDTSAWTNRASMPEQLWQHNAVATGAVGGLPAALVCGNSPASVACYSYSVTTDVWTTAMPMNVPRSTQGMTLYKGWLVHEFQSAIVLIAPHRSRACVRRPWHKR
jgi:hypothetical protein